MLPMLSLPALQETQAPEPLGRLLERARLARDAGRLPEAIQAYDAMLSQVPDHETALLERAETLGWAGRYAESREGYQTFQKYFPARAYTADLALARLAAWQNRTTEAIRILDPWVKQEQRQAILDAATYLSWHSQFSESLARVRRWLRAHPEDRQAILIEARVLSWAGRMAEAREAYNRILTSVADDREAMAGLARLSLWEGDPSQARRILDRMSPEALAQPESQVMLAQVETAEGHTRTAVQRLEKPALGGPAQRDAREIKDDLVRAYGPWVEITADRTDTSDGLRTENPGIRARLPLGDGAVTLGQFTHRSSFQDLQRQPAETSLGLIYPLGRGLTATGSLGRLSDVAGDPAWDYALGIVYNPLPGLDLNLARERALALYTPQAVDLRTALITTDLGAIWRFGEGRHALSGGLGQADLSSTIGGVEQKSTRHSYVASYEYRFPSTSLDLRGGLLIRNFGYSPTLPLGFFNPQDYRWDGVFGSAAWRQGRILEISLSTQAGIQTVDSGSGQFSWSYRCGITWSPSSWPLDLSAWWSQNFAGLPVTTPVDPSAYREHTLGLSIRIRGKGWI